jgi:outer membrane protein assembly factor BamB
MIKKSVNILLLAMLAVATNFPAHAGKWNDAERYALVTAKQSKQVSIIDVEDNELAGQLTTQWPIDEVAVSGFGDFAYLGHGAEQKLSVIDLKKGQLSHVLELSIAPRNMTTDPNVGVVITDSQSGGLALVDGPGRMELFSNTEIPASEDVIFNATGTIAYYYSGPAGKVGAVNLQSGQSLWQAKVPVSTQSIPLVRSLDGLFIVFVLPEKGEIHALNSGNGRLVASQRFSSALERPYVTANGQYFLVPEPANKKVHLISQATFAQVASVPVAKEAALVRSGLFDLVGLAFSDNELYAFDLLSHGKKTMNKQVIKGEVTDAVITSDSKNAFATLPASGEVLHLNIKSGKVSYIQAQQGVNLISMGASNAVCH